jgi:sugar/nucleoside kinase (ribokinase family)
LAKEAGLKVSIDLASYNVVEDNLDFLNEIIREYVDIVFANEDEARAFTNKEPQDALIHISNHCDIAVVKIGKEGSYVKSGDSTVQVQPRTANCIDTTGAGDLYAAGFLYGLACNYSLDVCGQIGSLVAANVVEVLGAKMTDEVWATIHEEIDIIIG